MDKIKVGVIGVGYFGQFHVEKYSRMEEVDLVGVVDINPLRANDIAKRYDIEAFSSHLDILDKVSAVSIVTPTPSHYTIAKDFLLNGIDVLLEKPISSTIEEADELIQLAQREGLILQVGHLERFNGALLALEGMIKDPILIDSHRLSPFSGRETDVSVVLDMMIHDIDIILNLVKSKVKGFSATGIPVITSNFDVANARIEFENGCTANLTASRVSKNKIRKTLISQLNETLFIDYLSQKAFHSKKGTNEIEEKKDELIGEIPVKKVDLLMAEIHSFLRSVRDRKNVKVSAEDGKRALEVALQIDQKIKDHYLKRDSLEN